MRTESVSCASVCISVCLWFPGGLLTLTPHANETAGVAECGIANISTDSFSQCHLLMTLYIHCLITGSEYFTHTHAGLLGDAHSCTHTHTDLLCSHLDFSHNSCSYFFFSQHLTNVIKYFIRSILIKTNTSFSRCWLLGWQVPWAKFLQRKHNAE